MWVKLLLQIQNLSIKMLCGQKKSCYNIILLKRSGFLWNESKYFWKIPTSSNSTWSCPSHYRYSRSKLYKISIIKRWYNRNNKCLWEKVWLSTGNWVCWWHTFTNSTTLSKCTWLFLLQDEIIIKLSSNMWWERTIYWCRG